MIKPLKLFEENRDKIFPNPKEKDWLYSWLQHERCLCIVSPDNVIGATSIMSIRLKILLKNYMDLGDILDFNVTLTKSEDKSTLFVKILHKNNNREEVSFDVYPTLDETVDHEFNQAMIRIKTKINETADYYFQELKLKYDKIWKY